MTIDLLSFITFGDLQGLWRNAYLVGVLRESKVFIRTLEFILEHL